MASNVECGHGILKNDTLFKMFLQILSEFDKVQQELFLMFISGSKKLPNQSWSDLIPKMKVVLKENGLPSVMTCAHYLKIRNYTAIEVFQRELLLAMNEGSEFHLS
eukprot:NODE_162_length_14959_cov_1.379610.p14 type:complete len:106 gc:universal NODE_162_length_14959_cov_1.379610:2477-2794(+)